MKTLAFFILLSTITNLFSSPFKGDSIDDIIFHKLWEFYKRKHGDEIKYSKEEYEKLDFKIVLNHSINILNNKKILNKLNGHSISKYEALIIKVFMENYKLFSEEEKNEIKKKIWSYVKLYNKLWKNFQNYFLLQYIDLPEVKVYLEKELVKSLKIRKEKDASGERIGSYEVGGDRNIQSIRETLYTVYNAQEAIKAFKKSSEGVIRALAPAYRKANDTEKEEIIDILIEEFHKKSTNVTYYNKSGIKGLDYLGWITDFLGNKRFYKFIVECSQSSNKEIAINAKKWLDRYKKIKK